MVTTCDRQLPLICYDSCFGRSTNHVPRALICMPRMKNAHGVAAIGPIMRADRLLRPVRYKQRCFLDPTKSELRGPGRTHVPLHGRARRVLRTANPEVAGLRPPRTCQAAQPSLEDRREVERGWNPTSDQHRGYQPQCRKNLQSASSSRADKTLSFVSLAHFFVGTPSALMWPQAHRLLTGARSPRGHLANR